MRHLLYKELTLNINKFFFILPILLGALFMIPNWIFTFVFMYFIWITVPQIFSAYSSQRDYSFISMLPVKKKDVVTSKVFAIFTLELVHLVFGAVFAIIHILVYGSWNFMMDINLSLFAVVIATFGIFNVIFLPQYFRTAYKFGKPLIIGAVVTVLIVGFFEFAAIKIPFVYNITESSNGLTQLLVLLSGIVIASVLSFIALKRSIKNYELIS